MCNYVRLCLYFMPINCKEYHPLGKALLLPDSSGFRLLLTLFGQSPKQSSLEAECWHDFHICRRRNHEPREMYFTQLNVMARRWHFPCNRLCLLSVKPLSKQVVILADFLFVNRCTTLSADNWDWLLYRRKYKTTHNKRFWLRLIAHAVIIIPCTLHQG